MDISGIVGQELKSVAFVEDFLQLRFDEPLLHALRGVAWHVLLRPTILARCVWRAGVCRGTGQFVRADRGESQVF